MLKRLLVLAVAFFGPVGASAQDEADGRIDLLTFARGAVPLAIGGDGKGADFEHAVRIIDGSPGSFTILNRATDETVVEFLYELPALTRFDRFAVPNVLETPSPTMTFFRDVQVLGSSEGPEAGFSLLAEALLETHAGKDMLTELTVVSQSPVRWIRLRLQGGIFLPGGTGFLEFSELIGNGTQDVALPSDGFSGNWKKGANEMALEQDGALVSGCYDGTGKLEGTVDGSILRATGVDLNDKTKSAFILSLAADGSLRGVRSSNGGPFRLYVLPVAAASARLSCKAPEVRVGCGSVLYGLNFDYDSAVLRPEAAEVLAALHDGLNGDAATAITIEGHTSSEGSSDYNQALSERRAQSVVDALISRGIPEGRLEALGVGEARPIAGNDDESGRSMNRRVEVVCR